MSRQPQGARADRELAGRQQLVQIVGAQHVIDDASVLADYSRDQSFAPARKPCYVVKPKDADEVKELVHWANRTSMPLIPVSSGAPHFRGDTVPSEGGVILDLSRMDAILRVDRRNRVAMIQPGVRFAQLARELEKQAMRTMMPLAPRATKSVLGSYLEREPILIPKYHWDMSDPLLCLEVIFGKGDLFRTGAAAGPGTLEQQWEAGQAQKNPLGPSQCDFYRIIQGAQGTIGVVTWATIKLELIPSVQETFMVGCERVDEIIDLVYRMLRLKLADECLILNGFALASILERKPDSIESLANQLPPWILIFTVAGYDRFPDERVAYQSQDIMDIAKASNLEPSRSLSGIAGSRVLQVVSKPSEEPYWKLRYKGGCQDIFFLTTLDRVQGFIDTMRNAADESGLASAHVGAYIQPIQQGRACHLEFNITYDPEDQPERDRAAGLFDRAGKRFMEGGAFFSLPYGQWAQMIHNQYSENVVALRKVKAIFDPNNVMNPGKLYF